MLMRICLLYNTQFTQHRQPRVGHGVSVRPVMMMLLMYSLENRRVDLHKQKETRKRETKGTQGRTVETMYVYVTNDL